MTLMLRLLAILCLLGAVAGISRDVDESDGMGLVVVDISQSMEPIVGEELLSRARELLPTSEIFAFSGEISSYPVDSNSYSRISRSWEKLDVGASNLEKGLSKARKGEPVIFLTDGYETKGNVRSGLESLRKSDSPVFPLVPQKLASEDIVGITALSAPLLSKKGESVDVRVALGNTSALTARGELVVRDGSREVLRKFVQVEPQKEVLIAASSDPLAKGVREITAEFKPDDSKHLPSSRTIFLSGEEREKVLLLNGSSEDSRILESTLRDLGYELDSILGGQNAIPFGQIDDYKVVVLNNVPFATIKADGAAKIETFVKTGGSLLMLGGNQSFGLGGYIGTPIDSILPVNLVPPHTEQKRLNVAVQLVLDKSQSMSFDNKIDFVKDAAREVVKSLKDDDYIGVMGFDDTPFPVVKMGLVGQVRSEANEKIGRIFASGKTNLAPAIDEARKALERAPAGRKHLIILTDGKIPDAGPFYVEFIKQLRISGITASTVMLGSEDDFGLLRQMANVGGGTYYQTSDAMALPRIFISDIKVASGEKTLKEDVEYDARIGPSGVKSTSLERYPALKGYVETKPKDGANLEIVVFGDNKAEPLLASWQVEQGNVIAYTSDANGRWSTHWAQWDKYRQFWNDIFSSLVGDSGSGDAKYDLRYYFEGADLALDFAVYSGQLKGDITAQVTGPDGTPILVGFDPIASGHFKGVVRDLRAGRYDITIRLGPKAISTVAVNVPGDLFGERKGRGFNRPLLEEVAAATGGRVNPSSADVTKWNKPRKSKQPLDTLFLSLGLTFLLLEILIRQGVFRYLRQAHKSSL